MASSSINIVVGLKYKVSLWDAIKMRIAGNVSKELLKVFEERKNESKKG